MLPQAISRAQRAAALLALGALAATAGPASAAGSPASPVPSATPAPGSADAQLQQAQQQAQQQLEQARQNAAAEDAAVTRAQADLAATNDRLSQLTAQISELDKSIASDTATVNRLHRQADLDRAALGRFVRVAYEKGSNSSLTQALAADSFSAAMQREVAVHTVSDAMRKMVDRISKEQSQAAQLLDGVVEQRKQVAADHQQTQTLLALSQVEETKVEDAAYAAHQTVTSSQGNLNDAIRAKARYDAAVAALAAQRARRDLVFPPVPGVNFTIDTDLTIPSGETPERLNNFLKGTALHDLGGAFMDAEKTHHVSARYLLAHAIEESAFGTSQIAQDKYNLYGYGANDANPYADAYTFTSFANCVDVVSGKVSTNYLTPTGPYYHGPTLRGMNVNYATDPSWANNIARIANTFA